MIKCFYYYFGKVNFRAARKLESTSDIRIVGKRVAYSFWTFPSTLSRLTNLWRRVSCKFDVVLYFSNYEKQISTSYFPSSALRIPRGHETVLRFKSKLGQQTENKALRCIRALPSVFRLTCHVFRYKQNSILLQNAIKFYFLLIDFPSSTPPTQDLLLG